MQEDYEAVLCRLTELQMRDCEVTVQGQLHFDALSNLEVSHPFIKDDKVWFYLGAQLALFLQPAC